MQTFLPYPLYEQSAKVLDNKRLGKQRVECLQLLKALRTGPVQNSITPERGFKYKDGLYQRKTPWYNHPSAKMWKGYERELAIYGLYICQEWINRGFKDTCYSKIDAILREYDPNYVFSYKKCIDYFSPHKSPDWLGNDQLHSSHRSNLLRKNPVWYGQFGWVESPNLPYVWPK